MAVHSQGNTYKESDSQRMDSAQGEYEINLLELMYRLLEKAKYIVAAALLGAILAGIFTLVFIRPKYTATTKLYVMSAGNSAINLSDLQIGSYLASDYKEVFSNWSVHEMVMQRLGLNYTYRELDDMIEITNPSDTRLLYVNVTAKDPDEAKLLADTYAQVACEFIASTMDTEQPNIFEEALKPSRPSSPSKLKNVIIGFLLGVLLSAAVVTIQFVTDDRIRNSDDLQRYFGLSTLGMMPQQPKGLVRKNQSPKKNVRGGKIA